MLAIAFGPYFVFDLLFQESITTRYALPAIVPGVFVGRYISQKLDREAFLKYIYFALMVVGCVLMVEAVTGQRL